MRKDKVFCALTLLLLSISIVTGVSHASTPVCGGCDVVILDIDVFRRDHMGFFGYFRNTTPNLDHLAASSLFFDNAFSPAMFTFESDVSLLSGKMPSEHGMVAIMDGSRFIARRNANLDFLPLALKKEGYRTGAFLAEQIGPFVATDAGFDVYYADGPGNGSGSFENTAKRAIDFLRKNREEGVPSFVLVGNKDLHDPYYVGRRSNFDPDYRGALENRTVSWSHDCLEKTPEGELLLHKGCGRGFSIARDNVSGRFPIFQRDLDHIVAAYDSGLLSMDARVGKFLSELDLLGRNNTLLIVVSEHAEALGEGGVFGHGDFAEEVYRIPIIINYPGVEGRRVQGLVSSVAVKETVRDALGLGRAEGSLLRREAQNSRSVSYQGIRVLEGKIVYQTAVKSLDFGELRYMQHENGDRLVTDFRLAPGCPKRERNVPTEMKIFFLGKVIVIDVLRIPGFLRDWLGMRGDCERELEFLADEIY